jgi:hypothetical protein
MHLPPTACADTAVTVMAMERRAWVGSPSHTVTSELTEADVRKSDGGKIGHLSALGGGDRSQSSLPTITVDW